MVSEDQLAGWTGPSSTTEQDKQERTERMVREAIAAHEAFKGTSYSVYAKGSYANNTNVRSDSDVDIAVECRELYYYEDNDPGIDHSVTQYTGEWTPAYLRTQVEEALRAKFSNDVDASGSTAIQVTSSSARVDADVVPSFTLIEYFASGRRREGTRVFKKDGVRMDNYAALQLELGRAKNNRTGGSYKKTVRILKRLENAMVSSAETAEMPSYLLECLIYNCPETNFSYSNWTAVLRACIADIFNATIGPEPTEEPDRWLEANGVKFLFHSSQRWDRVGVHKFAGDAWDYMGFE